MSGKLEPVDTVILVAIAAALLGAIIALVLSLTILKRQMELARSIAGTEIKQARFRWRVLGLFMMVSAMGVTAIWVFIPPRYRASAEIQVGSPFPKTPMQLVEPPVPLEVMERHIAAQAALLKNDVVLSDTLTDAAVINTDWYRHHRDKSAMLIELEKGIDVRPEPQTNYLEVSFATKSKKDAPVIVNTVINKYLFKIHEMWGLRYASEIEQYKKQERMLVDEINRILEQKQRFVIEKLGAPGITEGINVIGETLGAITVEVSRLEAEKLEAKAVYENLVGTDPSQIIIITPPMRLAIQQDPEVARLQDKKLSLELDLQTAQSKPATDSQLQIVNKELNQLIATREKELREDQIRSAHTRFLNAMQAEMTLRERMLEAENKQRDLDQGLAHYRIMEDQQKLLTAQLNQIREYIGKLQLVIDDRDNVRVHRINLALEPASPDLHRQIRLTVLAIIVPLVLGLVLGYLRCGTGVSSVQSRTD